MIRETLKKAQQGHHLTRNESFETFREIMGGEIADPVLIGALLTALQMNGPSVEELTGAAQAMRRASVHIHAPENAVDIVGTGGDGCCTFNCSTTAAFIAAGAGVTIVKHGNRASTSKSGAADCLAALVQFRQTILDFASRTSVIRPCVMLRPFARRFHSARFLICWVLSRILPA